MIFQLLLLAVAFFGTWLMLQPTEQFTYARNAAQAEELKNTAANQHPRARCALGFALCIAAIITIFVMQG